jgi:dihydrolipoamide dehydrogenase
MGGALKEEDGFVKVMAQADEILGVHIIGPQASTLIHEVLPVMRSSGGVSEIKDAIHIHPALSEVVGRAFDQL